MAGSVVFARLKPIVSIVINNHNYERYVGPAIDSALAQHYPSVEVVVVDDGSTDGSGDVVRSYGDDVVAVFQDNRGQTAAMNTGFARATGDIVCFLDADDVLYPSAADAAVALLGDRDVARGFWSLDLVDQAGHVLGRLPKRTLPAFDRLEVLRGGDPHLFAIAPTSANAWSRPFLESLLPLPEIEPAVGYGSAMADCLLGMASLAYGGTRFTVDVHGRYLVHDANDFARRDVYGQLDFHLAVLPLHFERLEAYVRSRGIEADAAAWRRRSAWFRLAAAVDELTRSCASAGRVAIADDGWRIDRGAPFPAVPFPEREGEWWGVPADDAQALEEVERARSSGVRSLALLWTSFWWLDHFVELREHLEAECRTLVSTDDVIVFDLGA
jgi:glycosyltransferase involved in cell wall biosynthesis